jgi:hypothetical protein
MLRQSPEPHVQTKCGEDLQLTHRRVCRVAFAVYSFTQEYHPAFDAYIPDSVADGCLLSPIITHRRTRHGMSSPTRTFDPLQALANVSNLAVQSRESPLSAVRYDEG